MKLAGIIDEALGYPVDDNTAMVELVLQHVLLVASRERVPPIGELTIKWATGIWVERGNRAVRWELAIADVVLVAFDRPA